MITSRHSKYGEKLKPPVLFQKISNTISESHIRIEYFENIVGIDILSFTWETLIDIVYRTPVFLWKSFGNITASIKLFLPGATSTRVAHGGTSSQLTLKIISSRWEGLVDDNLKYKHRITYSLRHYELKFFRTIMIIFSQQLLTGVPRYPHWCTKRKRKKRYY